jgi:hypothetical protein
MRTRTFSVVENRAFRIAPAYGLLCVLALVVSTAGCIQSIQKQMDKQRQKDWGFRLKDGSPVFTSGNSELLAPDWNEPVLADAATFKVLSKPDYGRGFHYACDATKVFIGVERRVYELENADPKTFKLLDNMGYFAQDSNNVYFVGMRMPAAQSSSFQVVGKFYAKDANSVYFGPMQVQHANPRTFSVLSEGTFSLTGTNHSGAGPYRTLEFHEKHDVTSYEGCWAKDDKKCFFGPRLIPSSDVSTFRVIDSHEAEDKGFRYRRSGQSFVSEPKKPTETTIR